VSTVKQIADAEGDEAEADETPGLEPNESEQPEPEPEPEQEPAPPEATEADYEAAFKKLETEAERHDKEVHKRAGPLDGQLSPCPLCFTPGYVLPVEPGTFDPLRRQAVIAAMGDTPELDYAEATDAVPCEDCKALGQVLTGSKVPGQETKPCPRCAGSGWHTKVLTQADVLALPTPLPLAYPATATVANGAAVLAPAPPYPGYGVPFVPVPNGVPDGWGRPAGHPQWGLDPATVTQG
jgi:hypothetical protein